ncbi:MAG: TonB-dependent receptor plug domain-containing protein [Pseudomonadales bacterium]
MAIRYFGLGTAALCAASILVPQTAYSAEGERKRIEEVVVTAERRESTVQDTAISITAFNDQMIEDFGLRNQEDLQNYIPATTIQPYDISIRGVGRVFRALGGDPGVATYFNGAYSEDFGIASTEGGLYDIERIEVLRGPQGTLYGRNGVGGAVNFHTAKPTQDVSAEIRSVVGNYGTAELYGFFNAPLIEDKLAARFTGVHREREGTVKDLGGGPALDAYGDENYALALRWTPTDNFTVDLRGNERSFRRIITSAQGAGTIVVSEAAGALDEVTGGKRNTSARVFGYRAVDTTIPCASLTDRTTPNCTVAGLADLLLQL